MRIFINALSARLGGGQTYLLNLLKQVPQQQGWKVYVLVQPSFTFDGMPDNVVRLTQPGLENPLLRAVWEQVRLPTLLQQYRADWLFSPGGLLPLSLPSGLLTAVTFQNMLPFDRVQRKKYPFGYRRLRDWLLERGLSRSMRKADLTVFISEFARDFIRRELGDLKGTSIVAPHGLHPRFIADPERPLPWPNGLPERDYLLYVSFIDHYKAQIEVVQAYGSYRQQGGREMLVLAGAEYRPYGDLLRAAIAEHGLGEQVLLLGNVPHDTLPALYQHARMNIFASFTENCPNILLEIMASGRPALVSNRPPMPEFGADAVVYFDPANPEELTCRLVELSNNEQQGQQLARAAKILAISHTWEKTAEKTWDAMASVTGKANA